MEHHSLMQRLRERGVFRVALSYGVIAWLVLQIASVVFEPLGVPRAAMFWLIAVAATGFPVAIVLAWFFEITPQGVVLDTRHDGEARPRARGLLRHADLLFIACLLLVIAGLLLRDRPWESPTPTLAVLPLADTSALPGQDYFSEGFAASLLDRFARVPGLRVTSRDSSFSMRQPDTDPRVIAARLGVTYVLGGSVGRAGGRIALAVELIDGTSGARLWSASFERPAAEVFALQQAVLEAVVAQLLPEAPAPAAPAAPTANLAAWDLYLSGLSRQARAAPGDAHDAAALFERAVALDPGLAPAWAALAAALTAAGTQDADAAGLRPRAEAAARRALALDPSLSEAHRALGDILSASGRANDAEPEYRRALELNANDARALRARALLLEHAGRADEATALHARADALDPLHAANGAGA